MNGPDFFFDYITKPEYAEPLKLSWDNLRSIRCMKCGGDLVDGIEIETRTRASRGIGQNKTDWWHTVCPNPEEETKT